MNYTQYENNNYVLLKGKIKELPTYSHTVMGEGFFEMFIEVQRLSDEVDVLPITISERLIKNFKLGDEIGISGQFRSYNKIENNKSKLVLTVFVRELCEVDEHSNPNIIEIYGYICKSPIYRTTPFNREITDVLMAVNRSYNKSDYIPCITWGRNARFVGELPVGTKLEMVGRIQSREYFKKQENSDEPISKMAYEISVSKVIQCE